MDLVQYGQCFAGKTSAGFWERSKANDEWLCPPASSQPKDCVCKKRLLKLRKEKETNNRQMGAFFLLVLIARIWVQKTQLHPVLMAEVGVFFSCLLLFFLPVVMAQVSVICSAMRISGAVCISSLFFFFWKNLLLFVFFFFFLPMEFDVISMTSAGVTCYCITVL